MSAAFVVLIFEGDTEPPMLLSHVRRNEQGLIESGYVINGAWQATIKSGVISAEERREWMLNPCREIEIPEELLGKPWQTKLDYAHRPEVRANGILRQASDYHQVAPKPVEQMPYWVIVNRPGLVPDRKGGFHNPKLLEDMLRELYELYPDCTCTVIQMPSDSYPQSGREWISMHGDQRRKDLPPEVMSLAGLGESLQVIKELKAALNDGGNIDYSLAQLNPDKPASSIMFDMLTLVETRIKEREVGRTSFATTTRTPGRRP